MGRQSARIYFNGKDHKEMVTWDGSQFVYHDKAYIWTGSDFELVWEKLYGLKLLYESTLELKPVSSENNKYLYFTEGTDESLIYRLIINQKEPEPEEWYTSQLYTVFTAPTSSRGIGIHRTAQQYANSPFDYRILNLETGGYGGDGHFDFVAETGVTYVDRYGAPIMSDETASQAYGLNYKYSSIMSSALLNTWTNYLYFVAITGISAMLLGNNESSGSIISGMGTWDIGRLEDDPTARGLMPRFLNITRNNDFVIWEYEDGNLYLPKITSTPPFSIPLSNAKRGIMRDGEIPLTDTSNRLWFVKCEKDSIEYTDTELDVSYAQGWDVDPSHKYLMDFKYTGDWTGTAKIIDIKTRKTIVDISDEINDMAISGVRFVGHKCLYVWGYEGQILPEYRKYRLYKWR